MLVIKTESINQAWNQVLLELYHKGESTDNDKYYRDEPVVIEVQNPSIEKKPFEFPMLQVDLDTINNYIVTGQNENEVVHEWTKIYYHRIWNKPNSQIEYVIHKLKNEKYSAGEVQISMWDKNIDQNSKISPCTQILWFRIKNQKLEMHVHAHSSDAYKKLLMNMQEFVAIQIFVADELGIGVGRYYHFVDSCHLHYKDLEKIRHISVFEIP